MPTLTFNQAPHGAYATNTTPVDGVVGNAVTVSNSTGASGQYTLDDKPYGSALAEGNLGVAGTTTSFTPDVVGSYMVALWVAGVRVARLAFGVPNAFGDVVPPNDAIGDVVSDAGVTTLGNFRPVDEPAKGWKRTAQVIAKAIKGTGTANQVARGDGTLGAVPAAALPAPTGIARGGVMLDGTVTHFLDGTGATRALNAGDGVLVPGAYAARHESCSHWYKCDDASNPLVNSIAGNAHPLANGGAGAASIFRDQNLYVRGTYALRLPSDVYTPGTTLYYLNTAMTEAQGAGYTLEATVQTDTLDDSALGEQTICELGDGTRANAIRLYVAGFFIGAEVLVAGVSQRVEMPIPQAARMHVLALHDGAGSLTLIVNKVGAMSAGGAALGGNLTRFCIGDTCFNQGAVTAPFRGAIADVRLTPAQVTGPYVTAMVAALGLL